MHFFFQDALLKINVPKGCFFSDAIEELFLVPKITFQWTVPKTPKTARSCRFALHNIRKIRPFLTEHAAKLLVQALVISRLDYCNALLAGLPSNTIKPLQIIQNAAARLVFNEPKRAHVTPLFISLHWLPVAARIQFKTLMLAYRTTTGSAPTYFHSLLQIYTPSWDLLVSDASWYHHREAQNHSPEDSLSPLLAGGMIFFTFHYWLYPV